MDTRGKQKIMVIVCGKAGQQQRKLRSLTLMIPTRFSEIRAYKPQAHSRPSVQFRMPQLEYLMVVSIVILLSHNHPMMRLSGLRLTTSETLHHSIHFQQCQLREKRAEGSGFSLRLNLSFCFFFLQ